MATILYSLVGSCAKKLQEAISKEAILILGVEKEFAELQRRMPLIRGCLVDAERRRIEEPAVNIWLVQLRDAIYDVDDIIDMARFEGNKLLPDHSSSSSRKSVSRGGLSVPSFFSNISARHEVAVKIKKVNKKMENILKDKIFLTFDHTGPASQVSTCNLRKSSSLVEPNLVGKEIIHSSRKLVDLVLAHKEDKAYKLSIVGTGGVGKTTLAQKIYNDKKIKGNFNSHIWISVSQNYNDVHLLKEVLRNIGVHQEQGESIAELQRKLAETIEDKSFFLVLDDVWQSNVWTNLLRTPLHAAAGGVILVTTRDATVGKKIGAEHTHQVDLMSVEVGWELLWESMHMGKEKEVQTPKDIGIEIVRKCGGLPLAIKVIAGVLASKDQTENEWKKILNKNAWSKSKLPDEIEGALYLSYHELPHHLKQCFLYSAICAEDSTIRRDGITRLWVAEGFVEEQQGQLLEETAEEYYYELIHRNLLQPDRLHFDLAKCKMHDLLRMLACYLSREECFIGDPESLGCNIMNNLRHILVITEKDMLVFPSRGKYQLKLRTLRKKYEVPFGVPHSVFKKLFHLRVLDLTGSSIQSIPDYIGNLIHLRLLDLDHTGISCLPESISSLKNLQILQLQGCDSLHSLPSAITQLCNLRRLGLGGTELNQVPKGIGKLEFLNDLGGFPVCGKTNEAKIEDGWKLEELQKFSHLRQLDMIKLERAVPCGTDSLLADKRYLKILSLFCTERTDEPYTENDVGNIEKIFEQLIPPSNLEDLVFFGFFGRRYPTWLGTTHLPSLKYLVLIKCKYCVHLPSIGSLPNLKYLKIIGATAITKIEPEFMRCKRDNFRSRDTVSFPKLECLVMEDMPNREEWSFVEEEGAAATATEGGEDIAADLRDVPSPRMELFPCLKRLELESCPKLRTLPQQLGPEATSLQQLDIRMASCLKAVENFPFLSEKLGIQGCKALESISNLPLVKVFFVAYCPKLSYVDELRGLQQLWLDEGMHEICSSWVPGLQQQHRQNYGDDLEVYKW